MGNAIPTVGTTRPSDGIDRAQCALLRDDADDAARGEGVDGIEDVLAVDILERRCEFLRRHETAVPDPVPCERAREFVTAADNQTQVRVRIGQGESSRFAANTLLGELELSGLPPGLRGSVQITVTFALDTNGMLNVSARDAHTGRATSVDVRLVGLPDQHELAGIMARQAAQRTM